MGTVVINPGAANSLMAALCFLRMSSEYVKDVSRTIDANEYRIMSLDKPTKLLRDAFNHLVSPLSLEDREKLQKELEQYAEIQELIAYGIALNPENLKRVQDLANELYQSQ